MDFRPRALTAAALLVSALALALPAAVGASSGQIGAYDAVAAANNDPLAGTLDAEYDDLVRTTDFEDGKWEVSFKDGDDEVGLAIVDANSGRVTETWTGPQVSWEMARGYEGAFGRSLNAPYVFLPFCALFLICLVDWRRPLRWVNADLIVLLGLGLSHIFFNRAEIGASTLLVYPVLIYLAGRMAWVGYRGLAPGEGLRPVWPTNWLLLAGLFLVGVRLGLNLVDSGVIDVGLASVVGAAKLVAGESIYGNFPDLVSSGDTYGPMMYLVYVPFELVFPWSGAWDSVNAAHAAAIFFDLAIIGALYVAGRTLGGRDGGHRLGVILAVGWVAYPYTAFILVTNTNDALIGLLVLLALLLAGRPLLRGAVLAAAAMSKFAPLVLVGLLARAGGSARRYALGFAGVVIAVSAYVVIAPGIGTFIERTIAFQADRESPFSIWGQLPELDPLKPAVALALAAGVLVSVWRPRKLDTQRAGGLSAALLIGTQLLADHWFYLYIAWFYPLVLVALSTGRRPRLKDAFRNSVPVRVPARSTPPSRRTG